MVSKSWREEQVFQAIYVSERFLDEFNMKMLKARIRTKAKLVHMLLAGWLDNKYQLPTVPEYVQAWAGKGGIGLSLYYPKDMDQKLIAKMVKKDVGSKAVVFRALLYGWTTDQIKVDTKYKKKVVVLCRSVGVALSPVANKEFKAKAKKAGLSKSGAITKLLDKWATGQVGLQVGNSDAEDHRKDHCFGIMLSSDVDDRVEHKMNKDKLTNKRIIIRKLVDLYVANRIKI